MNDQPIEARLHLCESCAKVYPECDATREGMVFGCGVGNDNVIGCTAYVNRWTGQSARVLTLEEAQAITKLDKLVWLEVSGGYEGTRYRAYPCIVCNNTKEAMYFYNTAARAWSGYNHAICGWRLWTAEPSNKERLAVKWE